MKRKDIRAGVVYAETSAYGRPSPVVFLEDGAATVWLEPFSRHGSEPYIARGASGKPRREKGWTGRSSGYATVAGPAEALEGLDCAAELAAFKARQRPSREGLRFALAFTLAKISGPYAEAVATFEAGQAAARAKRHREDADAEAAERRALSVVEGFAAAGFEVQTDFGQILLDLDEAERLLALLPEKAED